MTADALRENPRGAVLKRLNRHAVGVGPRRGQLGGGNAEHADRLARNGIGRLSAAPRANRAVLDGRARERTAKTALLGVAYGELGVGREQEQGLLIRLEVMMDIGHAHLLVAPQQGAERVTGRYALAQQVRARIQGEHRRALVVDHAAAEQPALASLHGKRVGGPARAGGHHVHVRDRSDVLRALAGDIRVAYKALVVTRLVAQSLGDAERAVQRGAHGTPERRTGLGSRRIGHGRVRNERGDIRNDVLPHLVDVRVDALPSHQRAWAPPSLKNSHAAYCAPLQEADTPQTWRRAPRARDRARRLDARNSHARHPRQARGI